MEGGIEPPAHGDEPPRRHKVPRANRGYLIAMGVIVLIAVLLLGANFVSSPIPPGVDSGDWTQRSYAYVGLAHPPVQAVGSPFLYPPLMFPPLGALVVLTASPLYAAFLFAGLLMVGYGLSTIHLARRYLTSGPSQLLFVGLGVLNGTTLSMLFWGAYPNYVGFIFFNEAFVFLLLFLQSRRTRDGLLFYGSVALVFLAHSLTFALLIAALLLAVAFLFATEPRLVRILWTRGNLLGAGLLAVVVATYTEVTAYYHIPHPSYFSSNPPAYLIDNIGELFVPLSSSPAFTPAGATWVTTPLMVNLILAAGAAIVAASWLWLRRARPSRIGRPTLIAAAWLIAALVVPVAGWYAHIETDYPRFVYYLPLPMAFFGVTVLDAFAPKATPNPPPVPDPLPEPEVGPGGSAEVEDDLGPRRAPVPGGLALPLAVGVALVLLVASVSVPTAIRMESSNSGVTHDAYFLQAMEWLKQNPQSGSMLTTESSVRWSEAITNRGAYDIGPTWLLFEPWQILNAQETYWALNSQSAITNNQVVLSYSGFGAPGAVQSAPMLSGIVHGVTVPLLRVPADQLNVTVTGPAGTITSPAVGNANSLSVPGASPGSGEALFSAPNATVEEVSQLGAGGSSWVNYTVTPQAGTSVKSLSLTLASLSPTSRLLRVGALAGFAVAGSTVWWNISTTLGQLPGAVPVNTVLTMSQSPLTTAEVPAGAPTAIQMTFLNGNGSGPLQLSFHLSTSDVSNPAVTLPAILTTPDFLASHNIHFLLVPTLPSYLPTVSLYEAAYGYRVGFLNSEWSLLQG